MSFGVSASAAGTEFDYAEVFTAADEALYEAKRLGRNQVCVSPTVSGSENGSADIADYNRELVRT